MLALVALCIVVYFKPIEDNYISTTIHVSTPGYLIYLAFAKPLLLDFSAKKIGIGVNFSGNS